MVFLLINLEYFINSDKFVTAEKHASEFPGEGNGFCNTGLAWACGSYKHDVNALIESCTLSPTDPRIWRSPHKKNKDDDNAQDDYECALPMSEAWAKRVLEYAETHGWDFDLQGNANPKYRFDRFLSFFPQFLRLCAGKDLPAGDLLALIITGIFSAFKIKDADTNKKSFCMLKKARQRSLLMKLVYWFWKKKIKAKYGTIGMSWAESMPGHPLNGYDE